MEVDKVLEEIRKQQKEGNVVFLTIEGFAGSKLSDFIQQPADGILYDLNRDKITTITLAKAGEIDKRWVNDYAVATTIEYIHGELATLRADLARVREERDRLREMYNNLRMQVNNVNQVYWEYDDWEDRAGEIKLSLEAILAMFPQALESEDEDAD